MAYLLRVVRANIYKKHMFLYIFFLSQPVNMVCEADARNVVFVLKRSRVLQFVKKCLFLWEEVDGPEHLLVSASKLSRLSSGVCFGRDKVWFRQGGRVVPRYDLPGCAIRRNRGGAI